MRRSFVETLVAGVALAVLLFLPTTAFGQAPKSAAPAKELAQALVSGKLDAIAAKLPNAPDQFAAALFFPGSQLLVVTAKYSAPLLLDERLAKKDYREIYIELNSASDPASRTLVADAGADGLRPRRNAGAFDTWDQGATRIAFDGDWNRQKISEADYEMRFAAADDEYARLLALLLAEAKKGS